MYLCSVYHKHHFRIYPLPSPHPSLCGLEVGSVGLRDPTFLEINALMEIYFVQYTFYDVLRNIMFLSSAENLLFGTDTEGLFLFALSQQRELSRLSGAKQKLPNSGIDLLSSPLQIMIYRHFMAET